jgi:hypothetical protein
LSSIFDRFNVTEEEAVAALEETSRNPHRRDGGICICGHPRSKHLVGALGTSCVPAKQYCPCKKVRVVLESSDTRHFLFKTEGGAANHALMKGLTKAVKSGAEVEWLGEDVCDRCGKEAKVDVVPVSQRGVTMNEATGYDVLLCVSCRMEA